jgi:hypothetical protein
MSVFIPVHAAVINVEDEGGGGEEEEEEEEEEEDKSVCDSIESFAFSTRAAKNCCFNLTASFKIC